MQNEPGIKTWNNSESEAEASKIDQFSEQIIDFDSSQVHHSMPSVTLSDKSNDLETSPVQAEKRRSPAAQYRHDLRTPFNLIIGYSEMLIEESEETGDEYFAKQLGIILQDAKQLLTIVDRVLDPNIPAPSKERLSHDLIFPLSHLIGQVERLQQKATQDERANFVPDIQRILKALNRFEELISHGYLDKASANKSSAEELSTGGSLLKTRNLDMPQITETGHILVVDDNESNRNMLSRRLERQGHSVKVAENGRCALDMLHEENFDLLLLDVMMPEMDGYEVLERLHADEVLRDIPVIMISALDQLDTVVRCIQLGAEDYLPKPFNPVVLRARIGACLEKKRLRDRERSYIRELRMEQERSDRLLLNILPAPIADRLKNGQQTIADSFPDVTVMFADLVNFTKISEKVKPVELVGMLNEIFSIFDFLAEKHGLEKIKTIGDEYMVAGGLPMPRDDHAEAVAAMALDMLAAVNDFNQNNAKNIHIRIGINTGPVTAGVIGKKKFSYDLWGDTVNLASRMESHGIADAIQVSENSYQRLKQKFLFQRRGNIHVKGKGILSTYLLTGRC